MIERPPLHLPAAVAALSRCAVRTTVLIAHRQLHQPTARVGQRLHFADGTTATVYRETVVDRPPVAQPAALVVGFRLRGIHRAWAHALFRLESELNTVLFAGFPGFVSKLWCRHDGRGVYRGVYEWDDPALAEAYVRALWWVLALVSVRGSIHYAVLPGIHRDQLIEDPSLADAVAPEERAGWWRLAGAEARAA